MKEVPAADFEFSAEQITQAADTWLNFQGFSGESCSHCDKTVNVLRGGPGWFCVCGKFNTQDLKDAGPPHETPDLGPTRATIDEGIDNSKKWGAQQEVDQEA